MLRCLPRLPLAASHPGTPGAWPSCSCFSAPAHFRVSAFLPPLFWCPLPVLFWLMSRGDDLCWLAAQLTALAELEESIAHGLSRVMGSTGSGGSGGSAAPAAASAPVTASTTASSTPLRGRSSQVAAMALLRASGARSRSRSPAPLPKRAPRRSSSVATVAPRGSVALAESGLVTGFAVKSCPPVPPAQLRLSRASRALQSASSTPRPSGDVPDVSALPARASEAPSVPDVASNSDSDWDALLDAHGLTPPPTVAAAAVAQPADAAGASRRARDKRRRRLRKAAKRSMWRDI